MAATSLLELVFAMGLAATISLAAVSEVSRDLDHIRATGAARHVAARLQRTRLDALTRNRHVAVRIANAGGAYSFATYVDGNGDGVLSRDIQSGVDTMSGPVERLEDQFPGVVFGTLPNLPAIDASSSAPGSDPILLGASDMVSFTPLGTATSGTVYLLGRGSLQLAVRIFGETGRTRLLRFEPQSRQWLPLAGQ